MLSPWMRRWLFTTNHKDIGILYFVTALYFGFLGALLSLLIRTQLSVPMGTFLQPAAYNQTVTLHGLIMILWFLSPLGIAFANYFVPLQIGAKDLALPRLNALGYWMYLTGGLLAALGFLVPGGNAAGGWTTYAPLSSSQYSPGPGPTLAFAGLIMLVASITMGTVNFLLTVAYMRGKEVTLSKVPVFTWFIVFTMLQMLFSFPAILGALLILMSDRLLGTFYFTSSTGGALLWDDLFWFFGHPEVYVVLLPALGMITEVLPVFSGKSLAGKKIILLATGAVVVPLSYVVWQHHMFLTGVNLDQLEAFDVSTHIISIPFGVILIAFIRNLAKGRIKLSTPMLFALGGLTLFIVGGVTGVFLSSFILDVVFRGTYFVVAHFHYVMVGTTIFGIFAGAYYWLPKMTGKLYSERIGKIHFVLSFVGFNVLYFPLFFLYEMPRRIYTYTPDTGWGALNFIGTIGAFIFTFAQIFFVANLIYTLRRGVPSSPNPWGATTLEWMPNITGGSSPQHADVHGGTEGSYLSSAGEHLSSRPVSLSVGLMVSLLGVALKDYGIGLPILLIGIVITGATFFGWARDDIKEKFSIPEEPGERWPFLGIPKMRLGMWIFLSSEVVVFGAILASYLFVRVNFPHWPAAGSIHEVSIGLANTIVLLTSGLTAVLALQAIKSGNTRSLLIWLTVTFMLGAIFMGIKGAEWYNLFFLRNPPFTFSSGLPGSTYYFTVGIHGAHVTAGLVVMIYLIKKTLNGGYSRESHVGIENFSMYWAFVDIVWMFVFPLFYLL